MVVRIMIVDVQNVHQVIITYYPVVPHVSRVLLAPHLYRTVMVFEVVVRVVVRENMQQKQQICVGIVSKESIHLYLSKKYV
jgi:hypothetical protein